jgi:gephyrin
LQIQDPSANPDLQSGTGSIRDSNKATLTALINGENGFPVVDCGIAKDDVNVLFDKLKAALSSADIVVCVSYVIFFGRNFSSYHYISLI